MAIISYRETKQAWERWFDYHRDVARPFMPSIIDYWAGFTKFLGCEPFAEPASNRVPPDDPTYLVPDDTYHKVQMLLGPHSYTIIKAWYAKQEEAVHG